MAILRSGILGTIRGKVAGVVGGQWKDKNYVREYVKPANPNTAAQQVQRTKFGKAVAFAQPIVGAIFNVYVDPFQKSMSGFNFFIKSNVALFLTVVDYASILITQGKLFAATVVDFTADSTLNKVIVKWSVNIGSNGAATDPVYVAIYNETRNHWAFADQTYFRSTGAVGLDIDIPMDVDDVVHAYVVASQYVGTQLRLVSNSSYDTAVAVA